MATRKRAANAAVVVQEKRLEQKGPVRVALHKLLAERVHPETQKSIDDVQRTKDEYQQALDLRAEGQSEELDNEVRKTWVAMQAAPAVLQRMKGVVLPGVASLADSDEAFALDDQLQTTASCHVFGKSLAESVDAVEGLAVSLGQALKELERNLEAHCRANRELKTNIETFNRAVRSYVPNFDLAGSLPRGTLDVAQASQTRFAAARMLKKSLKGILGDATYRRYLDALSLV